jgi:hypothetical protein
MEYYFKNIVLEDLKLCVKKRRDIIKYDYHYVCYDYYFNSNENIRYKDINILLIDYIKEDCYMKMIYFENNKYFNGIVK